MLVPSGAFTYYSYRDPNSLDTFSVFNQSADWVLGDNFGQAEVEEAVLSVFQVEYFSSTCSCIFPNVYCTLTPSTGC